MTLTASRERTELWPHQQAALDALDGQDGFYLAHSMGCGKSRTAIEAVERRGLRRVLIVAPKSVVAVWPDQFAQHAAGEWTCWHGQVMGARGPKKNPSVAERAAACIQAQSGALRLGRPFAAVVNYEAFWQGDMAELALGGQWDALILDEAHRIKMPGGKASKLAARVGERVRAQGGLVLALSGTPMPHSPLDLWAQIRALDGGDRLGTSYQRFCQHFAKYDEIRVAGGMTRNVPKGLRPDRADDFTGRVAPVMHHVETAEVLDLPETSDLYRTFELSPKAQRIYAQLERDLIAEITADEEQGVDSVVTAANAMVNVLRLAQVTSGYAVDADTGAVHEIDQGKEQLLRDILLDIPPGEPVVVFARFRHDLDRIERVAGELGRRYGELSGRRRDALDGPRLAEGVTLAGVQTQSGGVGLDLTAARHCVMYTLDFRLADYLQARARVHRPGQDRHVNYFHLLAENTIDRAVFGALRAREEVIDAVITTIKEARP